MGSAQLSLSWTSSHRVVHRSLGPVGNRRSRPSSVRHPFAPQLNNVARRQPQHLFANGATTTRLHHFDGVVVRCFTCRRYSRPAREAGRVGPLSSVHIEDREMVSTHSTPSVFVLISSAVFQIDGSARIQCLCRRVAWHRSGSASGGCSGQRGSAMSAPASAGRTRRARVREGCQRAGRLPTTRPPRRHAPGCLRSAGRCKHSAAARFLVRRGRCS